MFILEWIKKIIEYDWASESDDYREINNIDSDDECLPDENDNHVFVSLFYLNDFLSKKVVIFSQKYSVKDILTALAKNDILDEPDNQVLLEHLTKIGEDLAQAGLLTGGENA
jgi:hypothetical protein